MGDRKTNEFLPLPTATLHILLAIDGKEKHGYAIMGEVERLSGGAVTMGPGTLYGSIKRMLAEGLIEEVDARPDPAMDDERRRYYRLTSLGQRVCAAEVNRLRSLLKHPAAKRWASALGQA
jgi:DNA-binding PadR family transcriptional regulator